jgi:hypothetical protein
MQGTQRMTCSVRMISTFVIGLLVSVINRSIFADDDKTILSKRETWERHTIDDSSRGADGVKMGDINRDGLLDIVTGWEEGREIHVCLNPGRDRAHNRWPSIIVGHVQGAEDAIFVDLDEDGSLEVLSCTEGKTRTVYLHHCFLTNATKHPNLADSQSWSTSSFPATENRQAWMQAAAIDIDGLNGNDLILASKATGGSIGWLKSPKEPLRLEQWTYHPLRDAGWIMSLETYDVDRDGDFDIVFSDRKGKRTGLYWLENPGALSNQQGQAWIEHAIGGIGRETMFADIADINNDGLVDIAVAVKPVEVIVCFQQPDKGWREQRIELDGSSIGDAKAVKVLDVNLDGRRDLCFTCENADKQREGIVWLEQLPDNQWKQHPLGGPDGVKFDQMQVIDLDGDGDQDIITCEERDQLGVVWYENPQVSSKTTRSDSRPRLAILTDIGGDPDDQQSLIRLMVYANEFEIEALIASASGTRGELNESVTRPDLIRKVVKAYGQVLPNLERHARGWPAESHLLKIVKSGNPGRERLHIGEGHDTEASQFLIERIDSGDSTRPLNIAVWGGQTDLGQAIWRAQQQRTEAEFAAFVRKFRVYDINDQDGIADWMRTEFPGLHYVLAKAPLDRDKREGTYRGMYLTGDESATSLAWVQKNVLSKGPLGALYPTKTFTSPNQHSCLKEGDTPSWFFFLPLGGNDPNDPNIPGWGGQFVQSPDGWWRDQPRSERFDPRTSVSRWRTAFQNDFAKRMKWCLPEKVQSP